MSSAVAPPLEEVLGVLAQIDLLDGVEEGALRAFAAQAEAITYPAGELLWPVGTYQPFLQVLIGGAVEWLRDLGGEEVAVAVHRPISHFGAIASLSRAPAKVMARALEDASVLRFPADAFRVLCVGDPDLLARMVRLTAEVVSSNEGAMRERDRLASMGTLAAGLAHEINNPAAAALRQVAALRDALGVTSVPPPSGPAPTDALARADREEELAAWLRVAGVPAPWELAATLADAGADVAWCEGVGAEGIVVAAQGVGARGLLDELEGALGRITALVSTMRDYANLDRMPEQDVEVAAGITGAGTVVGIEITLEVQGEVPRIPGYPGELSQLWTELLRNAAAAGPGAVEITVRRSKEGGVHVALADRGPGIPDAHLARVWEPFFSTKPGSTGLGLDLARRVVESHRGRILLGERDGGGTVVTVELPGS